MVKNINFLNEAAKSGAIIGSMLAFSSIVETSLTVTGIRSLYILMIFEWVLFIAAHYYLLHRFTAARGQQFSDEQGFSFGNAYSYLLLISAFSGLIVGVVQYIHINLILGYGSYVTKVISAMTIFVQENGQLPQNVVPIYDELVTAIQSAAEPSLMSTVWGGVNSGLFFGLCYGLIIAGVLSRAPRPFKSPEESPNE